MSQNQRKPVVSKIKDSSTLNINSMLSVSGIQQQQAVAQQSNQMATDQTKTRLPPILHGSSFPSIAAAAGGLNSYTNLQQQKPLEELKQPRMALQKSTPNSAAYQSHVAAITLASPREQLAQSYIDANVANNRTRHQIMQLPGSVGAPLTNITVQSTMMSQSINLGKQPSNVQQQSSESGNAFASSLHRQRGSYRHTVDAHTLQNVLNGATVGSGQPLRQSRLDSMVGLSQSSVANQHMQQQFNGSTIRQASGVMKQSSLPRKQKPLNAHKQQGSSLQRQQTLGGGSSTMNAARLSDMNVLNSAGSGVIQQKLHQTASSTNLNHMLVDTTHSSNNPRIQQIPVDQSLANSFKFNPIARERNAIQVAQSSKVLPQLQRQASQRPRGISNEAIGTNQRQVLAPLQQPGRNNPAAPGVKGQPKTSKNSKAAAQLLEQQIAKNLMPNFVLPAAPQNKLTTTIIDTRTPLDTDNLLIQFSHPVSPRLEANTHLLDSNNSNPAADSLEDNVDVMEHHMQNMAQYTASARQTSNRRSELPSSKVNSKQVPKQNQNINPEEETKTDVPILEPLDEPSLFVGHETSPSQKETIVPLVALAETSETGCGPVLIPTHTSSSEQNHHNLEKSCKTIGEEIKQRIARQKRSVEKDEGTNSSRVETEQKQLSTIEDQKDKDKQQSSSDSGDSEMAENLIQQTYVEKKADRLIKEFHTESDDEAEIDEVKSAVKQIKLEEEVEKFNNDICGDFVEEEKKQQISSSESKNVDTQGEEKQKLINDQNIPVDLATTESPQQNDTITGSSARESQNSSNESNSGGSRGVTKNDTSNVKNQNNNLNMKKSLLTSSGCGPDGNREKENAKVNNNKIKLKRKVDQTTHITKFSQSLVFNAIERVTKAGCELIMRSPEQENILHQMNQGKVLYDFDTETGLEACRKFLECLENLFALSFLKRASREYRQHFTAAYRVLYDNPVASPLNYLVEILDSAQESFPYLWVNGKKYEFSQMVLQQGNMMYQTFSELKEAISQLHLSVVTAKATMSNEFCQLSPEELLRHRTKVERLLEQFDQDWSIYERAYVTELMAIESDARRHVTEAIRIVQQSQTYENDQKRRGRILNNSTDEEYNHMRNKFLRQICEINQVANSIGQGRDDLDVSVLIVADEVSRKISASQSLAVRQLCTHIQRSFNNLRNLFVQRYAENVEVVDPQLRNNPELVHLVARFEKAWCLGRTHLVPKDEREQLISFSQLIEGTCEKYPQFKEQVECSDAEIFLTIPNLLVLKSSLDTGKEAAIATSVCQRFFPIMFQRPDGSKEENPTSLYFKFQQLKADLSVQRVQAGDSFFEFYNKIEQQILFGNNYQTPASLKPSEKQSEKLPLKSTNRWKILESQAGVIKEIGMSMTRQQPTEWNEFMIVALGIPEDEPLPFLQEQPPQSQAEEQPEQQPVNETQDVDAQAAAQNTNQSEQMPDSAALVTGDEQQQ